LNVFSLTLVQQRQIVDVLGDMEMLGPEDLLINCDCLLVKGSRFGVFPLTLVDTA